MGDSILLAKEHFVGTLFWEAPFERSEGRGGNGTPPSPHFHGGRASFPANPGMLTLQMYNHILKTPRSLKNRICARESKIGGLVSVFEASYPGLTAKALRDS